MPHKTDASASLLFFYVSFFLLFFMFFVARAYGLQPNDEETLTSKIDGLEASDSVSFCQKLNGIEGKSTQHYFNQILRLLPEKLRARGSL